MKRERKKYISIVLTTCVLALALVQGCSHKSTGEKTVVKCSNPACDATYEWNKNEFDKLLKNNQDPRNPMAVPALPCNKCGKKSVYIALKCEKCGELFTEGAAGPNCYRDKCPKCGYSFTESLK